VRTSDLGAVGYSECPASWLDHQEAGIGEPPSCYGAVDRSSIPESLFGRGTGGFLRR
jgi:hypothetical protein